MSTLVDSYGNVGPSIASGSHDSRSPTAWGPVFAGAVAAIASQLLLTVLGIALGVSASAIDSSGYPAVSTISMLAGIWWLLSGTVSLAIGGAVLGMLWNRWSHRNLMLHAIALWSTVAVFGFLVIVSGAGIASSAASPMAMVMARPSNELSPRNDPTFRRDDSAESIRERTALAETARDNAKVASWWAVFGMIVGLTATIVAATAVQKAEQKLLGRDGATRPVYPAVV